MELYSYEILDRTHVIMENIESHIIENDGCTKEMKELAVKAQAALSELYQLAGKVSYAALFNETVSVPTKTTEPNEQKETIMAYHLTQEQALEIARSTGLSPITHGISDSVAKPILKDFANAVLDKVLGEPVGNPMETAPKDGSELLIYDQHDGVNIAFWQNNSWCVKASEQDEQGGWSTLSNPQYWIDIQLYAPKEQ